MNPIELNNNEAMSFHKYWADELKKCTEDDYYFFSNYCLINGEKPKITREEYYEKLGYLKSQCLKR